MRFGVGAAVICLLVAIPAAAEPTPREQIVKGVVEVLQPRDPTQDGVLTVAEGNLWVQCLSTASLDTWRCEAAGLEGQPWLRHVLTAQRQERLSKLGFVPDATTGNFLALTPVTTPPDRLADRMLAALTEAYGASADDIEVLADRLPARPCHVRLHAEADRGGSILTPHWGIAKDARRGCGVNADSDAFNRDDPTTIAPHPGADIEGRYLKGMAAALQALENSPKGKDAYVIFDAGPAYVQCMHDIDGKRMYCEASSEDAVGRPIERILTPDRVAKLTEAGFLPPGKVMNYSRFYPRGQYDAKAVAKALLTVLHDAYGYEGDPPLTLTTAGTKERPL
jgi:hypothetical protein